MFVVGVMNVRDAESSLFRSVVCPSSSILGIANSLEDLRLRQFGVATFGCCTDSEVSFFTIRIPLWFRCSTMSVRHFALLPSFPIKNCRFLSKSRRIASICFCNSTDFRRSAVNSPLATFNDLNVFSCCALS